MKKHIIFLALLVFVLTTINVNGQVQVNSWQQELKEQMPLLGHRNWILVVDAAYPLQSKPGIKTIVTNEAQLDVVEKVLKEINTAKHIFPEVFMDKELDYVLKEEAAGIGSYRIAVEKILKGSTVSTMLHEELIAMVDESAQTFNVLILKTKMTLPYTSVFFRLNCGYWNTHSEQNMRKRMEKE